MGFHPNTPAGDNPLHLICKSIRFCGGGKQINDKIYKRQKNTPVRLDGSISNITEKIKKTTPTSMRNLMLAYQGPGR